MSEELRTAVLEGLRAFAEEEPDFAMSHGMRARAADFILAQPRPALEGDIVGMLRKAAAEMRSTHHAGWPNVCDAAAEALAALKDRDVVLEEAAKDKERLDWLQSEMFDVRWVAGESNQMCSPSDGAVVRIVSHWMAAPQERVEAENWHEDLRAVIDEARQAQSKERV